MRDTNDMMEDAICEDTMMECSGDGGGLEDLVNLASDIADSAPSIRDAAERLLTLLGVDDDEDDASSSEDEGVEVDLEDSDTDEPQETRLLHQLAASLAQELKYAKQNSSNSSKLAQSQNGGSEVVQSMDFVQEATNYPPHGHLVNSNPFARYSNASSSSLSFHQSDDDFAPQTLSPRLHQQPPPYPQTYKTNSHFEKPSALFGAPNFQGFPTHRVPDQQTELMPPAYESCTRIEARDEGRMTDVVSWGIGWDACASEALRYLVEDEGLPPHHPTVVAMKNHLDVQRARVLSQFAT